jgi:ClpP class serine protease
VPNWNELLQELQLTGGPHDVVRRHYLGQLSNLTRRNTIVYYSAWLQKPNFYEQQFEPFTVNDNDMNGFMATIHNMDKTRGLDLILHTPGGDRIPRQLLARNVRDQHSGHRAATCHVRWNDGRLRVQRDIDGPPLKPRAD